MNGLSWILYAADVLDNLKGLLIASLIAGGFGLVIALMFCGIEHDQLYPRLRAHLILMALAGLAASALPSRQTVYMIAGSEVGQRVAASPDGQEVLDLVRKKIKDALK